MDQRRLEALIIVCAAGFLYGCQLGYPTLAVEVTRSVSDCSRYQREHSCNGVVPVCFWNLTRVNGTTVGVCAYQDQTVSCGTANRTDTCEALPHCGPLDSKCVHDRPWSAAAEGAFIATGFVGTMIAGLCTGFILAYVPQLRYLTIGAVISITSVLFLTINWHLPRDHQINNYSGLLIGRILAGIANGVFNSATLYGGAKAPAAHRDTVIMTFDVCNPMGAFAMPLAVYLADRYAPRAHQYYWFNVLHLIMLAGGVLVLIAANMVTPADSKRDSPAADAATPLVAVVQEGEKPTAATPLIAPPASEEDVSRPLSSFGLAIVAGFIMAIGVQFNGAQIVMSFAPSISKEMGLAPFTGTLVLLSFNLVAAIFSLALRSTGLRPASMLVWGLILSTVFSMISAAATSPYVFPGGECTEAFALMTLGLFGKLGTLRLLLSPGLSVLVQRIFDARWRAIGASVVSAFGSTVSIGMMWSYPVIVDELSDYDSREGQAKVFFVLGLVTLTCAPIVHQLVKHVV